MKRRLQFFFVMFFVGLVATCASAAPLATYVTPTDMNQLTSRLKELHTDYAPYLRSLPERVELRERLTLNGDWRFTFEVKDPPYNTKAIPPAPKWFTADFDDSTWETTTVPE